MGVDQSAVVETTPKERKRRGRPRNPNGRSTEVLALSVPIELVVRLRDLSDEYDVGVSTLATALFRYGVARLNPRDLIALTEKERN